jgi:hypothetical protein
LGAHRSQLKVPGSFARARFVILTNGILTMPKLARIPGMEKFKSESFHTSRWNETSSRSPCAGGFFGLSHRFLVGNHKPRSVDINLL